jgi:exodeoxyribonuclease VII large subunit
MQGEEVERSIINALMRIYDQPFDCVVIIRGGGATSDLSGFDTLALAEHVANFPLPIITGIGHERDECILDMVSHIRVKTPTAAAALLIEHLKGVLDAVEGAQDRITRAAQQQLAAVGYQLTALEQRIPMLVERRFTNALHQLQLIEERVKGMDPQLLLSRGYSITLHQGKVVKDASMLVEGDEIETRLEKGILHSIIRPPLTPPISGGETGGGGAPLAPVRRRKK